MAGLYPKVAKIRPSFSKKRPGSVPVWVPEAAVIHSVVTVVFTPFLSLWFRVKVYTKNDGKVNIHPKSVNAEEAEFHYTWLIYHLKMKTSSVSGTPPP